MPAGVVPPCPTCHRIDRIEQEGKGTSFGPWFVCRRCEQVFVSPPRHEPMNPAAGVSLWKAGRVECLVVHHWEASSYEIQILKSGVVAERRLFDNREEATQFALQGAHEYGVEALR